MLSRTAEGLFWLGRNIERAENIARLLEAARRLDRLPQSAPAAGTEWTAILIAAGCKETYGGDIERADGASAIRHMISDPANPSSIKACFDLARGNARAQRVALTTEVWSAANDAWREIRAIGERDYAGGGLARVLDLTRKFSAEFRGAVSGTMLRNAGFEFIRLGEALERADATARLLDVKYHVLLPEQHQVGDGYDQLQWNHLLRAAGARSAYRWTYTQAVSAELVVDFLVLNARFPRALRYCHERLCERLQRLSEIGAGSPTAYPEAESLRLSLIGDNAKDILARGLHEYLTERIIRTNTLALNIGDDFGFGPGATQAQSQAAI